ncbi:MULTISPECIES: hypothetical protein [unclassified Streptomyces]|uniref:hypothetical protein n=1 Tax=unclassified Streptomyces TaxID=2593676 RepID=UPI0038277E51
MIAPHDYVGQDFAWFSIAKHIGSGAEAEVYLCWHAPTQRSYVLRLPAEDDSLWERDGPLMPPVNSLIEHRNAIGSAHAGLTRDGLKMVVKGQEFSFSIVQLYGVRDGRYLLPVSNNWSRKGALSFGAVLDVSPSLPATMPFWEMLQHLLVVDCYFLDQGRLNEAEWHGRWETLLAHSSSLDGGLQFAEYSPRARSLIDACGAGSSTMDGPTLEESAVMRIIYGVLAGRFTLDQIEASLSCPFFRLNITVHDIQYALCLLRLYQEVDWVESVARMLGPAPLQPLLTLLDGFTRQPLDHGADRSEFESVAPPLPETLEQYPLIVQEVASGNQPYAALERVES